MPINRKLLFNLCCGTSFAVVLFFSTTNMFSIPFLHAGAAAAFAAFVLLALGLFLAVKNASGLSQERLDSARKEERKRIAADLHDELGSHLALLKYQIDALQCVGGGREDPKKKAMEEVDLVCRKLRDITRGLSTTTTTSRFIDDIGELVDKFKKASGMPIFFNHRLTTSLSEAQRLDCYRVIQETLNNAVKHGHASQISLRIVEEDHMLRITCRDNGQGFDYNSVVRQNKGIGLQNIAWRMSRLKGKFIVHSHPGSGSHFRYEISLV
jgi:signal transduction histidine kinase